MWVGRRAKAAQATVAPHWHYIHSTSDFVGLQKLAKSKRSAIRCVGLLTFYGANQFVFNATDWLLDCSDLNVHFAAWGFNGHGITLVFAN